MTIKDKKTTLRSLDQITINADPSHLSRIFGFRFHSAWTLLEKGRIIKYVFRPSERVWWIVEGKRRDYLLLKNAAYCSCNDFYFGVVYGKALGCQHLILQRLGEVLGDYIVREMKDSSYSSMMDSWRENP